ncbi:MAG: type I secretion C-terminal target domain-containing protein [Micavibrio aeruginosavorus]|uniref:Type I secretion C-terminal target domain-containing protein n=1 Tax=Micavibrio aeruginosavorus TaxID=349221 RepID=A0A7T5R4D9_9BACT|nr:MAG: type I secretion C-terminal target domain-containing protein [Micavibrio aeruginosavorus]
MYGSAGNNTLVGNNGNDWLQGGAGADTLTGGNGTDRFVLDNVSSVDTITDYRTTQFDILDISNILAGFTPGVDDIDNFVSFSVLGGNTTVRIDADGLTGGTSWTNVATLSAVTGLNVQTLYDNGLIVA